MKKISFLAATLLIHALCFSQAFDSTWISELNIEGKTIQILRVPADQITIRTKIDIISMQKQLDRSKADMEAGKSTYINIISDIQYVSVQTPEWPVHYYEKEAAAYMAYRKAWERRDFDQRVAANQRIEDSIKLANQVAGYSFVNKPFVWLKEKPSATSMTMGKLYQGSYVVVGGSVEGTDYIEVEVPHAAGFILKGDVVDSLQKLEVDDQKMIVLKSWRYYKYEESAAYTAKVDKQVAAMIAAEEREQPKSSSSSKKYHWGPKGGCYFINSNGNKEYVDDKSLCR